MYFWTKILKTIVNFWSQHPRICLIRKFRKTTKMPKFGTKNAFFEYFCRRILEKLLLPLKPAPSTLSKCKISLKNENAYIWDQKRLSRYFWASILKSYCHIWNQHRQNSLTAKFPKKMKMPKFGTKSALLRYFWAKMFLKLLSYLKSVPSNLSNCKISKNKNKNA